jgi:hypothetical protein
LAPLGAAMSFAGGTLLPIPLVAFAILTGGLTIELLWAQGPVVAFLSAPVAASIATALTAISFRNP